MEQQAKHRTSQWIRRRETRRRLTRAHIGTVASSCLTSNARFFRSHSCLRLKVLLIIRSVFFFSPPALISLRMESRQSSDPQQCLSLGASSDQSVSDCDQQQSQSLNRQTDLRLDRVSFQQQDISLFMQQAKYEVQQMSDDMVKAQMELALSIAAATLSLSRRDLERQAEVFSQEAEQIVRNVQNMIQSDASGDSRLSDLSPDLQSGASSN